MGVITSDTDTYQMCITQCNRCFQACHECATLCLKEPDVAERLEFISMLMECAGICKEAVCFMVMQAKHTKELCDLCAIICDECSLSCSMFKDEHCIKCAEECKKCANECKSM